MKKLCSLLLTVALVLSLAVPALAVDDTSGNGAAPTAPAPSQVNVMYQGSLLDFPDVTPVLKDKRTMIPVRAVVEGMDGKVDWNEDTQTVTITLNGAEVAFPIGSDTFTVTKDGKVTTDKMDTAAYLQNHRTMVPLRFLSQAAGYTVLWDNDTRTAVVLDLAAKAAEIDSQFTRINKLLADNLTLNQGKKLVQTVDLTGELSIPMENGALTTYPLSASFTAYTDGAATKLDCSFDLKELVETLVKNDPTLLEGMDLDLSTILSIDLSKVTATVLLDAKGGFYLQCPVLNTLLGANEKAWLDLITMMGLEGLDLTDLTGLAQEMTMGQLLTSTVTAMEAPLYAEEILDLSTDLLAGVLGDKVSKPNGNGYTWTFSQSLSDLDPSVEGKWDGYITMSPSGAYDMRYELAMTDLLSMTCQGKGNNAKGDMTFTMAIPDVLSMTFTMEQTTKTASTLPSLQLPEGAEVISF